MYKHTFEILKHNAIHYNMTSNKINAMIVYLPTLFMVYSLFLDIKI